MADMIQYSLLRVLKSTLETGGGGGGAATCTTQSIFQGKAALKAAKGRRAFESLNNLAVWGAIQGAGRVGSLMCWKPQKGESLLAVGHQGSEKTEMMHGAKVVQGRSDVKFSYVMPVCSKANATFVLEEEGWSTHTLLVYSIVTDLTRA